MAMNINIMEYVQPTVDLFRLVIKSKKTLCFSNDATKRSTWYVIHLRGRVTFSRLCNFINPRDFLNI